VRRFAGYAEPWNSTLQVSAMAAGVGVLKTVVFGTGRLASDLATPGHLSRVSKPISKSTCQNCCMSLSSELPAYVARNASPLLAYTFLLLVPLGHVDRRHGPRVVAGQRTEAIDRPIRCKPDLIIKRRKRQNFDVVFPPRLFPERGSQSPSGSAITPRDPTNPTTTHPIP
jgi:hypothetical protein